MRTFLLDIAKVPHIVWGFKKQLELRWPHKVSRGPVLAAATDISKPGAQLPTSDTSWLMGVCPVLIYQPPRLWYQSLLKWSTILLWQKAAVSCSRCPVAKCPCFMFTVCTLWSSLSDLVLPLLLQYSLHHDISSLCFHCHLIQIQQPTGNLY
jgi:hypothetical protein